MPCIGILNQNLGPNSDGLVITYGKAKGLNTSSFEQGNTIYVSPDNAGEIINSKPINGALIQNIGIVMKKNENQGVVFVTGIGRSNDIPNASEITTFNQNGFLYVSTNPDNDSNRFERIQYTNFPTILQPLSTDPNGISNGHTYFNVSDNTIRVFNGTNWLKTNVLIQ